MDDTAEPLGQHFGRRHVAVDAREAPLLDCPSVVSVQSVVRDSGESHSLPQTITLHFNCGKSLISRSSVKKQVFSYASLSDLPRRPVGGGEQPVGIGVATSYGESGFIGQLIVRPDFRGQGIGAKLLEHAINYLRVQGAKTIYLDGIPNAVSLYERYGFRKVCRSLRYSGVINAMQDRGIRPLLVKDLPSVYLLDRQAFGADRSDFLAHRLRYYPNLCKVIVDGDHVSGFILGQQGDRWFAAGPWVVSNRTSRPESLLESLACEAGETPLNLGILESNRRGVELVASLGFEARPDPPWRMALGPSKDLGDSPTCLRSIGAGVARRAAGRRGAGGGGGCGCAGG